MDGMLQYVPRGIISFINALRPAALKICEARDGAIPGRIVMIVNYNGLVAWIFLRVMLFVLSFIIEMEDEIALFRSLDKPNSGVIIETLLNEQRFPILSVAGNPVYFYHFFSITP